MTLVSVHVQNLHYVQFFKHLIKLPIKEQAMVTQRNTPQSTEVYSEHNLHIDCLLYLLGRRGMLKTQLIKQNIRISSIWYQRTIIPLSLVSVNVV